MASASASPTSSELASILRSDWFATFLSPFTRFYQLCLELKEGSSWAKQKAHLIKLWISFVMILFEVVLVVFEYHVDSSYHSSSVHQLIVLIALLYSLIQFLVALIFYVLEVSGVPGKRVFWSVIFPPLSTALELILSFIMTLAHGFTYGGKHEFTLSYTLMGLIVSCIIFCWEKFSVPPVLYLYCHQRTYLISDLTHIRAKMEGKNVWVTACVCPCRN